MQNPTSIALQKANTLLGIGCRFFGTFKVCSLLVEQKLTIIKSEYVATLHLKREMQESVVFSTSSLCNRKNATAFPCISPSPYLPPMEA